jgi:hypothetical protein
VKPGPIVGLARLSSDRTEVGLTGAAKAPAAKVAMIKMDLESMMGEKRRRRMCGLQYDRLAGGAGPLSFLFVPKRCQHVQIDMASCQPTRCTAGRVCIAPHLVLAGVRVGKDVSMWHK